MPIRVLGANIPSEALGCLRRAMEKTWLWSQPQEVALEDSTLILLCVTNGNFQNWGVSPLCTPFPTGREGEAAENMALSQGGWREDRVGGEARGPFPSSLLWFTGCGWAESNHSTVWRVLCWFLCQVWRAPPGNMHNPMCVNLNKLANLWASVSSLIF